MRHILITRFNVHVPEWRNVDKRGVKTLDAAWLEHRWELFEKYTVPSVLNQTVDIEWVVLFAPGTVVREGPYVALHVEDWLPDLQAWLPKGWLATTRLDNDDYIAPTFIATIRRYLREREEFLNIPFGYLLRDDVLIPEKHTANPFMTYVSCDGLSVYHLPHGKAMSDHAPIIQIPTGRLWTQVIHGRNYHNG